MEIGLLGKPFLPFSPFGVCVLLLYSVSLSALRFVINPLSLRFNLSSPENELLRRSDIDR